MVKEIAETSFPDSVIYTESARYWWQKKPSGLNSQHPVHQFEFEYLIFIHKSVVFPIGYNGMYPCCFDKWYSLCIIFWSTIEYSFGNWSYVNSRTNLKKYVQVCLINKTFFFLLYILLENIFFSEIIIWIFLNFVYGLVFGFLYY